MKNDLDEHINELLSFISLLDRGTFSGKDAPKIIKFKNYLNEILSQIVKFKNEQRIGDSDEV